jgi:phage shock protein PspC (stress-responsive transcriptional regulator)
MSMQKVISINLNGNAYQLDEAGYELLREYLARAEAALETNPDRAEIIADLEQAIADKCQTVLGPHKSVVNTSEMGQIIAEMGPIDAAAGEEASGDGARSAGRKENARAAATPKRLYRIPDGAMIAGVCSGLAAYVAVDVTIIRVGFVLAAIFTKGVGIIPYIVMMFVVPEARTTEERAAAGGAPFNARAVIDRAKKQYAEGTREWRRQWRQQRRSLRRPAWAVGAPLAYGPPLWAAVLLPVFALIHLALFLTMAAMMISLVNTGGILDWQLPREMPVWAGALVLLAGYQIVVGPIRAAQHWSWQPRSVVRPRWYAFWNAVVWLVGLGVVLWFASEHSHELREFAQRFPEIVRDFAYAVRDFVSHLD